MFTGQNLTYFCAYIKECLARPQTARPMRFSTISMCAAEEGWNNSDGEHGESRGPSSTTTITPPRRSTSWSRLRGLEVLESRIPTIRGSTFVVARKVAQRAVAASIAPHVRVPRHLLAGYRPCQVLEQNADARPVMPVAQDAKIIPPGKCACSVVVGEIRLSKCASANVRRTHRCRSGLPETSGSVSRPSRTRIEDSIRSALASIRVKKLCPAQRGRYTGSARSAHRAAQRDAQVEPRCPRIPARYRCPPSTAQTFDRHSLKRHRHSIEQDLE